ncbi:MAG TPA: PxKF domain-containing protein [Solirubrobacteraceae bacterium]|nr:PxKF domain-containing protein [Solirubrobacteraceae bacterium]
MTFACTDGGSGTTSALTGGDVATEGANQSVTSSGTCVDAAGNQAAPSSLTFSPIKIDKTKPVITADTNGYTAGSWANSNVTVSFSCADSGSVQSGLAPGDDSVAGGATVSADTSQAGTDVGSTSTCTDLAGNVADPASVNVRIDTTRPTISSSAVKLDGAGQPAGTYTAGTWTNRDVEVTFACNDTGSGTTSLLTGDVVDTDGSDHVVASGGTCEDAAGNEASPTPAQFGPIKIDTTKPVIEADTAGYTSGEWTNQSVSVSFTCADEDGPVQSGFATDGNAVGGDTTLTGETTSAGTDVPASGTCTDQAGNAADPVSVNVKIDTTDPTIDGDAAPDANGMGWNNEDVTVTFTCDDPLSGLVSLCQGPVTLSDEGRGQAVSETAKDKAGNEASDTVGPINIDRTDPSTPTASPSSGQAPVDGWYKDSVTVSYGGSSDPALDDPREDATDKSGSGVGDYTDDQVFSTSGTHAYSGTATDNAGNESDAASGSVKVDANKPTVDITCPSGPLTVGTIAVAGWSASDGNESGLTGAASGTELLNTGSIGTRTATKTVNDKVGHSEVDSCSYTVVYGWDRFYRPIENLPTVNVSKAGSSVPVKFSLDGAPAPGSNTSGQGSESSVIADQYPRSYTMDCGTNPELLDPVDQTSTAGHSSLTYDAAADQWVYVWKTDKAWAGTCRQLVLKLADGTYRRANFKLTK